MNKLSKTELISEVGRMLRDLFRQHENGAEGSRLARAHGYLDGYMRGAVESGIVTHAELLRLVGEQRQAVRGPGVGIVEPVERAEAEAA